MSVLLTYWKQILAGVLLVAVVLYIQALRLDLSHKETQLAEQKAALESLNKSIDLLAKNTAEVKNDFAKLGKDVNASGAALDKKLAGVLAEKKPSTCPAAIEYLKGAQYK